ncbi:hypothetical protein D7J84_10150 [Bacillus thuringiensis]|uniref:Uncharacterized protein n=1 Tax=Bacillus thuringiensis TaxID=1428 RepID=A0A9W3YHT9_BACTU|nr:hypothetical protein D7J84_10150 [Bacillus thuringiensis]PNK33087.1 hypothetical protein CBR55_29960 [Bacillus thuringiensis]
MTRNIDLTTKIDNISIFYNGVMFQNVFRGYLLAFYFPKKNKFKGLTSSYLSTSLYTYPPL